MKQQREMIKTAISYWMGEGDEFEEAYAKVFCKFHGVGRERRSEVELPPTGVRKEKALEFIYNSANPVGLRQIADSIGIPSKAIQHPLSQLVKAGQLAQTLYVPDGTEDYDYRGQTVYLYSKPEEVPKFEGRRSVVSVRIQNILELLARVGRDLSVFEISERLGMDHSLAKNTIHYMKQDKLVSIHPRSAGRGKAGQPAATYTPAEVTA